ncbi:tyrosine-type recombinase/integrase [Streptomyces albidoflavus]|uniref:tyrosine-type recombinase/integrase n=1 Tax=Streptomyces albidoflavus TaxID=1886 RepID=UPI001022643D|nr:tyrosine-type recombinase/integrase [Streptomyces albidoflavus]RZF02800.1 integrase [Streptomyces albidoflavus]
MTGTDVAVRSPRTSLATLAQNPRDKWPSHARRLYDFLTEHYGTEDALPTLAAAWVAHQRSQNTQRTYARGFKVFEAFAREMGVHPMGFTFMLADTFRMHLETAPTWVRVKGGRRWEMARTGEPYSDASRANTLSATSSFYDYLDKVSDDNTHRKNPFFAVPRPYLDPDYSPTAGLSNKQVMTMLRTARDEHHPAVYRPRTYALMLLLYTVCLRIDSALSANVEDLGYSDGHRVIKVRVKGGHTKRKPIPPHTWHVLQTYLAGRTSGPLFITSTGARLTEPSAWRTVKTLARRAGITESVNPHGWKHWGITDALNQPGTKLEDVQDWADHSDPRTTRRYDRRKGLLDRSPGYAMSQGVAAGLAQE